MSLPDPLHPATSSRISPLRPLPRLIFASRWLQLPLYLGLYIAQGVYVILFLGDLLHLGRRPSAARPRCRP